MRMFFRTVLVHKKMGTSMIGEKKKKKTHTHTQGNFLSLDYRGCVVDYN